MDSMKRSTSERRSRSKGKLNRRTIKICLGRIKLVIINIFLNGNVQVLIKPP